MRSFLPLLLFALVAIILVWDVVLAARIAQVRTLPRSFVTLSALAGFLVVPALVIHLATTSSITGRAILSVDWLWPVTVTNIVVQSVGIFNDFTNPLYYLPGNQNATVQLTLYNFQSQFSTAYNLLFTNILLITIPPLIVFMFFNRQIVAGMTAGAVKG